MASITFQNVSKTFARAGKRKVLGAHLRDLFTTRRRAVEEPFYALRDISFEVKAGMSLGLIGPNGAGKSTALALATGICRPTSGTIRTSGHVVGLLELGSGFHPELTGLENMQLNAALVGMTPSEFRSVETKIMDFADIGDYIGEPLRTYSSGMILRLAFAVAIHSKPDALVVDEVIGVGDAAFQAKCNERLHELRERKITILCTSHAPDVLTAMCDEVMWIAKGRVQQRGEPEAVLEAYMQSGTAPPLRREWS